MGKGDWKRCSNRHSVHKQLGCWLMVKNLPATQEVRQLRLNPSAGKIPWRKEWPSIPVFWPGESHGQRSLAGYSPWGRRESDTAECDPVSFTVLV